MTLQQLEYLLALNQFRHFAKAAEYCHVTQPTLSAMIQKLEEELGAKIFDRRKQPITPTSTGVLVIQQAQYILSQSGQLQQIVKEAQESVSGLFQLGILPTIAPYLLPRFFPELMKRYPQLDIRVTEMKTATIKEALHDRQIDAGIVADLDGLEAFQQTHLFYEHFFAYVAKDVTLFSQDMVRSSDLSKEQLWLLDEGHCFRDQLVGFCKFKSAQLSQQTYHLGSMETFMRMVESGKGLTFIPELAVSQLSETQQKLVRPFAVPEPTRRIIMLTRKDYIRHTLLHTLTEEIQHSVPRAMLDLKPGQILI